MIFLSVNCREIGLRNIIVGYFSAWGIEFISYGNYRMKKTITVTVIAFTRQDWTDGIAELMQRIRAMDTNDLNEWITWFSNVIRKLNEYERGELITQIKEGDEKDMCSSFERLLNKEKKQMAERRAGKMAERRAGKMAEQRAKRRL